MQSQMQIQGSGFQVYVSIWASNIIVLQQWDLGLC